MLFLMLVPILIEPANLMWHTGSYMSFPCRYAFITIFFALICAGYFLSSENAVAKGKKNCDHFVIFLILAALIYGFYNFSEGFVENNRSGISKYTSSLWQDSTAFELCLEFSLWRRHFMRLSFCYTKGLDIKEDICDLPCNVRCG